MVMNRGVLPQRATSTHRFTDDERTTLLVSGQSVNTHARSYLWLMSLVFILIMYTFLILQPYPTQDGVGKQFTISGPQHTTRESFIGNTSSIVFDGADD